MKKFFPLLLSMVFIAGCSKKTVPAKTAELPVRVTAPAVELTESLKAGKQLYMSKCGNCHGLYRADDYTVKAWLPIIDRMSVKAKLNESEKMSVLAYVQAFSKK
jgi:hypothetical protein